MARTTPQEREQIISFWRKHWAENEKDEPASEPDEHPAKYTLSQFQLNHAEEWTELYNQGLPDDEIAARTGVSVTSVRTWRLALGLTSNKKPAKTTKMDSRDEKFMPLYRMGRTDPEIAKLCGVSTSAVFCWRKKNGLAPNRKVWGTK